MIPIAKVFKELKMRPLAEAHHSAAVVLITTFPAHAHLCNLGTESRYN